MPRYARHPGLRARASRALPAREAADITLRILLVLAVISAAAVLFVAGVGASAWVIVTAIFG